MGTDLIEGNTEQIIAQILTRLKALESRDIQTGNLAEISSDMGDIDAGRFIASSSGTGEPTDPNFSGSFMSAEGETFDGELWNIGGVNGGELQFGLSAETGKAYFAGGAAIIDRSGFTMTGLNYSVLQTADNGTTDPNPRYGWLEMFMPSGSSVPAWGLTYSDSTGSPITNGDFETGDLTGWTDSGTDFSVTEAAAGSGTYGLECADITSGTATLTSDRFACDAGLPYFFRFRTNEHGYASGTKTSISAYSCNISSSSSVNDEPLYYFLVGNYLSVTHRTLVDLSLENSSPFEIISNPKLYLWQYAENASNTRTMRVYRMLRAWDRLEATWSTYDGTNNWGTAGAANTTTDREATDIGSISLSSSESSGYKEIALTTAKIQEWISGALDKNGIQIKMDTESNDRHDFWSFGGDYTTPSPAMPDAYLEYSYTTPSDYTIRVDFYDDPTAGSLVSSVTLCTEYNAAGWRQVNKQVVPPTGAVSAEIVIEAETGLGFYVDDITMLFSRSLYCTDDGWDSSQGLFPTSSEMFWDAVVTTTAMTRTIDTAQAYNYFMVQSSAGAGNNGTEYEFDILLKNGTWKLVTMGTTWSGNAKTDIYLDDVLIDSGVDWYSASHIKNVEKTKTGIDVGFNGWHTLKYVINGQNASANSNYYLRMTKSWMIRTGD